MHFEKKHIIGFVLPLIWNNLELQARRRPGIFHERPRLVYHDFGRPVEGVKEYKWPTPKRICNLRTSLSFDKLCQKQAASSRAGTQNSLVYTANVQYLYRFWLFIIYSPKIYVAGLQDVRGYHDLGRPVGVVEEYRWPTTWRKWHLRTSLSFDKLCRKQHHLRPVHWIAQFRPLMCSTGIGSD